MARRPDATDLRMRWDMKNVGIIVVILFLCIMVAAMSYGVYHAMQKQKAEQDYLEARGDYTYQLEEGHYTRSWQGNGGGREVCIPGISGTCDWQPLN